LATGMEGRSKKKHAKWRTGHDGKRRIGPEKTLRRVEKTFHRWSERDIKKAIPARFPENGKILQKQNSTGSKRRGPGSMTTEGCCAGPQFEVGKKLQAGARTL